MESLVFIMNLRKAILVSLALSAQLTMFGQAVNLNVRNVSVKKAMTILKQQSGYSFVYVSSDLNLNKKINVNATNLSQAIEQIISEQNVSYEIKGKNIVLSHKKASSPKSIKTNSPVGMAKTHVSMFRLRSRHASPTEVAIYTWLPSFDKAILMR